MAPTSILGAISKAGVKIEMISLVIVKDEDKDAAVRAVHEAFLKDQGRPIDFTQAPDAGAVAAKGQRPDRA